MADKSEKIESEGEVTAALRGKMPRVQPDNGHQTLGHRFGRSSRYRLRVRLRDRVRIELSPYDLSRTRIVDRVG